MRDPVRIVFLGSYPWSVSLLERLEAAPGVEVVRILTTSHRMEGTARVPFCTPVGQWCREHGAEDRLATPAALDDAELLRDMARQQCHCALSVAYPRRIPAAFCAIFPLGGLNLHPSMLPRWRGPDPVRRALLAGDAHAGVTLHLLAHEFDAGDILWQQSRPLQDDDTCHSVLSRLGDLAAAALPDVLTAYARGDIAPRPQAGEVTYAAALTEAERRILPEMTLAEANRLIAALHPYKPAQWHGPDVVYEMAGPLSVEPEVGMVAIQLADGVFHAWATAVGNVSKDARRETPDAPVANGENP